jgi:hypothetical protein
MPLHDLTVCRSASYFHNIVTCSPKMATHPHARCQVGPMQWGSFQICKRTGDSWAMVWYPAVSKCFYIYILDASFFSVKQKSLVVDRSWVTLWLASCEQCSPRWSWARAAAREYDAAESLWQRRCSSTGRDWRPPSFHRDLGMVKKEVRGDRWGKPRRSEEARQCSGVISPAGRRLPGK